MRDHRERKLYTGVPKIDEIRLDLSYNRNQIRKGHL